MSIIPFLLLFVGLGLSAKGFYESYHRHNPFGLTPWLFPFGIFVWGDAVLIGLFWSGLAITSLLIANWFFLGLGIAVFWFIRAWGEVQYWIAEQFTTHHRNEPKTLFFHQFFLGDSIWFVYQVFWQIVMIVSVLFSLFFAAQWLL